MESTVGLHVLQRRVRQSNRTLLCHLRSIAEDAQIVRELCSALPPWLPVYGNLRNGLWYTGELSAEQRSRACYFKSTDGHERNLLFNASTRLNLDVAATAGEYGAVLIVDSTKQGKTFPDSMRVTIPLWCSVINKLVFPESPALFSPPVDMMSPLLAQHIRETRVPGIIAGLSTDVRDLITSSLGGGQLSAPLKPIWIFPDEDGVLEWRGECAEAAFSARWSQYESKRLELDGFCAVFLLSCSGAKRARHVSEQSWEYIQGAGDDEEHWAPAGLTYQVFWANRQRILQSDDHVEVQQEAERVVREQVMSMSPTSSPSLSLGASNLHLHLNGKSSVVGEWDGAAVIHVGLDSSEGPIGVAHHYFRLSALRGDKSKAHTAFRDLVAFYRAQLSSTYDAPRVLIASLSEASNEAALAIVLVLLGTFFNDQDFSLLPTPRVTASKQDIRMMVARLQTMSGCTSSLFPAKTTIKMVALWFSMC